MRDDEKRTTEELLNELQELRAKADVAQKVINGQLTQNLLDGFPSAIVLKDPDGRYLLVNSGFEGLAGMRKQDLIGKTAKDLFSPEYAASIAADDQHVLLTRNGTTRDIALPFQGTLRYFSLIKFPVLDEQGSIAAICGVYSDVTEQKRAETALHEWEKEYRDLAESISSLFFGLDRELRCTYWNKACEQTSGIASSRALGAKLADLFPERNAADMERLCRSALKAGRPQTAVVEFSQGERVRSYEMTVYPSRRGLSVFGRDVTNRILAEKSLGEAQRRFHDLLAKVNLIAIILDADGTITFCNDFLLELTGWKIEEVMGKNWFQLFIPDGSSAARLLQTARSGDIPVHYESPIRTKDGRQRLIRWNNTYLYNLQGTPSGLASIGEDISEYRRTEEELRNKNLLLNTTLQGIPDLVYFKDREGRILYVNAAFERTFGVSAAEVLGLKGEELLVPAVRENSLEGDQEVLSRGVVHRGEQTLKTAQGILTFDVTKTPLIDEQSRIVGLVGVSRDITERKNAEEVLAKSSKSLQAVVDGIDAIVYVADMQSHEVLLLNNYARNIFGDVTGQKCWQVLQAGQPGPCTFCTNSKLQGVDGQPYVWEVQNTVNGRWYDCHDKAIRWIDGRVVRMAVATDITERKRMEQELLKLQKLESVGILAGGIAHDFNNLLTAILGNIGLSKMNIESDGKVARLLMAAEDACAQAKDLSYRLLTFSKGGEPLKRTISINRLLRDAVAVALDGSLVTAQFNLPEDLLPVEADEGQLKQVISNLALNAVEAMPGGGTIRVSAGSAILGATETVNMKSGSYLKISISDAGEGIAQENLTKIFDPYFTTKEFGKQRGRGLGLAICHSIVRKHDGMITVDSIRGKGSTFHVYLPAALHYPKSPSANAEPEATGRRIRPRMLVMDDEDRVRTILKEMLEYLGYEVECAREGAEAIALYRQAAERGAPFNIVLLDLTVPGGTGGVDTLRKLRQMDGNVQALVSSGYVDDPILRDFRNHGFVGAIAKPYDLNHLDRTLREVLRSA